MFCPNCGANIPDQSVFCPKCGATIDNAQQPNAGTVPPQQKAPISDETMTVNRIRDQAKICAILWIVVGAMQILTCVASIAGVWNLVMGIRSLKAQEAFVPGNRALFDSYDNALTNMIITAVINFFVGGMLPIALSAFEFFIRDQVLKNKSVFGA